ncbi:MAG: alpha/beta hydrolase [Chloroflexi bacterium]|nr:alpha/beta hydrolase [Chloroflexota bacterium]
MQKEVVYLSDDHVASLTAYRFEESTQGGAPWTPPQRPAILVVPGGGYAICSDREADPVALSFLTAGYQAFVLNYHCGEASAYPTPLIEIAQAVAHMRRHSAAYGIDADKIAAIGFSAGGHLTALLGSSWHRDSLANLTGLGAEEMRLNAAILGYPVANLQAFITRAEPREPGKLPYGAMIRDYAPHKDPLALANPLMPPTYLFHTLGDRLLPPLETLAYVEALLQHGIPCEYHLFNAGEHGLSTADSLSCYGWDYPRRVHAWVPMARAWLNDLFQYEF